MKNRIGIIGNFGGDSCTFNGQTIKTIVLYDGLKKFTSRNVLFLDTSYKNKTIYMLVHFMELIIKCKHIVVLLSENGMNSLFPILGFFSRKKIRHVYHDAIGGNLHLNIKNNKRIQKAIKSFDINWVESHTAMTCLKKMGISNVEYLPNFRDFNTTFKDYDYNGTYRFCTFSRVTKDKGVGDAILALYSISSKYGIDCILDVYGPISDEYSKEFNDLLSKYKFVKYCGVIQQNAVINTLTNYYALLFPTYWKGEGFPGTIVDSFFSSLPVIASDHGCNKEIVKTNYTGIIYPNESCKNLEESILHLINQSTNYKDIRRNCFCESRKYSSEVNIKKIINFIEEKEK